MRLTHLRHALLPRAWRATCAIDIADGRSSRVEAGRPRAALERVAARASRAAEPPLPCVPARHGGPGRAARAGGRQFLDLARGDVPLPRPAHARRRPGDRGVRLHGDAGERASPRSASSTTCTTTSTAGPMPISPRWRRASPRRRRDRHRPDPAAGASILTATSAARRRSRPAPFHQRSGAFRGDAWRRARSSRRCPMPLGSRRIRSAPCRRRSSRAVSSLAVGPDPHPCRRADQGGRGLSCGAEAAAGRMAAGQCGVDPRWCLIHATHMTAGDAPLARSGAVAGLARSPRRSLATASSMASSCSGRRTFGVGSDSNILIGAAAELRKLEYAQRLHHRARNVMAIEEKTNRPAKR